MSRRKLSGYLRGIRFTQRYAWLKECDPEEASRMMYRQSWRHNTPERTTR